MQAFGIAKSLFNLITKQSNCISFNLGKFYGQVNFDKAIGAFFEKIGSSITSRSQIFGFQWPLHGEVSTDVRLLDTKF